MKYFGLPADFKKETIDAYDELNRRYKDAQIIETYGNITVDNVFQSGRALEHLPKIDFIDMCYYVEHSKKKNIAFNYTINAPYMNNREFSRQGAGEIVRFLGKLYDAGVDAVTVSLPPLIEIIKAATYDFEVKASTICEITNANKAMFYKNMGVERIVVDESINRDFQALREVREAFGDKIEIIVNSICHKSCSYRMFHYNQAAGCSVQSPGSNGSIDYYPHRCMSRRYDRVSNLFKLSWVRPEDIKYYTAAGINYFKLQGRQTVLEGDPVRAVECYLKEDYDGDLIELLEMFAPQNNFRIPVANKKLDGFIKPYYEINGFCRNNCSGCRHCEIYAAKAVDMEKAGQVIHLANEFYNEHDEFDKMIRNLAENEGRSSEQPVDIDINFDFV